mgnify:CR=1 FL=1
MAFLVKTARAEDISLKPPEKFGELESVTVASMVSGIISFLLIGASLIFFVMLVLGGIKWIMSEGDEAKVKSARDQVQNALIGLVVVFAAWAILTLIGSVFGVQLLENFTLPTF